MVAAVVLRDAATYVAPSVVAPMVMALGGVYRAVVRRMRAGTSEDRRTRQRAEHDRGGRECG